MFYYLTNLTATGISWRRRI